MGKIIVNEKLGVTGLLSTQGMHYSKSFENVLQMSICATCARNSKGYHGHSMFMTFHQVVWLSNGVHDMLLHYKDFCVFVVGTPSIYAEFHGTLQMFA